MHDPSPSYEELRDPKGELPLPCRGCMPDCKNRQHCQGKLWRTPWTNPGQTDQKQ